MLDDALLVRGSRCGWAERQPCCWRIAATRAARAPTGGGGSGSEQRPGRRQTRPAGGPPSWRRSCPVAATELSASARTPPPAASRPAGSSETISGRGAAVAVECCQQRERLSQRQQPQRHHCQKCDADADVDRSFQLQSHDPVPVLAIFSARHLLPPLSPSRASDDAPRARGSCVFRIGAGWRGINDSRVTGRGVRNRVGHSSAARTARKGARTCPPSANNSRCVPRSMIRPASITRICRPA